MSAFDIVVDINPTSPVNDAPPLSSSTMTTLRGPPANAINVQNLCPGRVPSRPHPCCPACPPAPATTSPQTHSFPMTTTTDDGWLNLSLNLSQQSVQIHPLVTNKTTPPKASSATMLEFALADPEGEQTDEDETSWCARKLDQVVLLDMPSSSAPARRLDFPASSVTCI